MGRKAGFTDDQVFVWLADHLAQAPGVTVQQVSKGTGVSVGSLYHRYGSMEGLLAESWLWAHGKYRELIEGALEHTGVRGAVRASLRGLVLTSECRSAANLLFAVPERYLVRGGIEQATATRIQKEKAAFNDALVTFAEREDFDIETIELAVIQMPKAILQKYLPFDDIPEAVSFYIKKTCRMMVTNPINVTEPEPA